MDDPIVDTHHGATCTISRASIYEDCIDLYKNNLFQVIHEYPFRIAYKHEKAIDTGGVSRDFFSAFWEVAYVKDFDDGSTYIPSVHPRTNMYYYRVLGSILVHGFMSCGLLPNRLAFPVVASTLLGCDVIIPDEILINLFIDYVSSYESSVFSEALQVAKSLEATFTPVLGESVLSVLSTMGCHEMPTPGNIQQLILQVARYELLSKLLGALLSLYHGVPMEYHPFFSGLSVNNLHDFTRLLIPPQGRL